MSEQIRSLDELIKELPSKYQSELRRFGESLVARYRTRRTSTPTFEWAGALGDLRDRYTSVDLQHQLGRWRIEGE